MSTSESGVVAQVEAKRSWKLSGIYAAACVVLVVFAAAARGDMTLRLNDKSQSYSISDIVTAGAPIVWMLAAQGGPDQAHGRHQVRQARHRIAERPEVMRCVWGWWR